MIAEQGGQFKSIPGARLMERKTVGVIGAQGRFGSKLCQRLANVSVKLLSSKDKTHTKTIAHDSDLLMIVVRPEQIQVLLEEITAELKPNAIIVSFVALYPLNRLIATTHKPAARVMGDPNGNMCTYLFNSDFPAETLVPLLKKITKTKPVRLQKDEEIDCYTILIAYLHILQPLRQMNQLDSPKQHFEFLADQFATLGVQADLSEKYHSMLKIDPKEALKALATPGGISETLIHLLTTRGINSTPEKIYQQALSSFKLVL